MSRCYQTLVGHAQIESEGGPALKSYESVGQMPSLRELRERKFLSQDDLSRAAGVSRSTIWELEGGRARPRRWKTIRKLAKALGVEPSEIEIPRPRT